MTGCGCPGCEAGFVPFSVEHFERWAFELELDTGDRWRVPGFFLEFAADLFAGFRECWLVVPEGNAKTTSLAGLALHHIEHTPAARVPWAASSREQAELGFVQAEGFVKRSPRLSVLFKCLEGYRRIRRLEDGGRLQIFAADDRTGDGIIPGRLAIIDELHRQRDLKLYRTWRGKLEKRDAQLATISTAGEPGSEFEETRSRIRQESGEVRAGAFVRAATGRVVLHDWAVPESGDVDDLELVKSANPFEGVTIESLREKRDSPTMTVQHWRRMVCNLPTRSDRAAITEAEWYGQVSDVEIPAGEPIWLGLDVGWKWDTTAIVPLWWRDPAFRLLGPATILDPPRDGSSLDPALVESALLELAERNPVHTLVMDTSRAEQLAEWARVELGVTVVDRSQGNAAAAEDYERFMEGLRSRWLWHSGDPGLSRHAMNAVARVLPLGDARFDRPSRTRQGGQQDDRVIDALVAAAMVHSVAAGTPTVEPFVMVL